MPKKIKITNACSHPKHNIYLSTAWPGTEEYFIKPPEHLISYFKLPQTAVMCCHCLYKTDNDPEYVCLTDYPSPIQKKILKENIKNFQGRSYILCNDIIYSEEEFQQLESAYHEMCKELGEAKLGM